MNSIGESRLEMEDFWIAQAAWSRETFGQDHERGPRGPIKHLLKEVKEALEEVEVNGVEIKDPDLAALKEELVDCQFLVFDAARRAGVSYSAFVHACFRKLAINRKREWQKAADGEPAEHVR